MPAASPKEAKPSSPFQGFLPFFWLAVAIICGVLVADWASLPGWVWLAGAFICSGALALAWGLPRHLVIAHHLRKWTRIQKRLPAALLAAVFFLGGWRYVSTRLQVTPEFAAFYNERGTVQLVGIIINPPDDRDAFTYLTLQVEELELIGETGQTILPDEISGRVLVKVPPGSDWAYGYRLRVIGQLTTPGENVDFSYRDYLARKGIQSLMINPKVDRVEFNQVNPVKAFLFNLQARAYVVLQQLYPSPEADLLAGILLGRDQGLSPDLQDAFRRTGTSHIIAISGFNIAILAGLFSSLFTRLLGRKWGALTAIAAILIYSAFVGGDAAVTRAAIMGALGVFGGMFGRRQNGLNSLGLAVLAMVLINPNLPWDVGFQLSAAATLGLVLYGQPLTERFIKLASQKFDEEIAQKLAGPISEFFLFTLAAQVTTLPIMMYHFGGVSWVTFIANPLILPVQPLVMILGGLSMLAGLMLPGLGQVIAILALPFVRYTIQVVSWMARLPGAGLNLPDFHMLWIVVYYAALFLLTLFPREHQKIIVKKAFSPQMGLLILTGWVVFTWSRVLSAPDGRLHLILLDGEGTVLLQTPGGAAVLIGGGSSPSSLNQALGRTLPAGKRHLDVVIIASASKEDLLGLTGVIKNYTIDMVLFGVEADLNQSCATIHALLSEKSLPVYEISSGASLSLEEGTRLEVLWSGARGAVLWLEWGDFSAVIPTGKVEDHWLKTPNQPDIVILPDGLKTQALPLDLINAWSPTAILFPLSPKEAPLAGDHPVITMLRDYPFINTVEHGWVSVSTDGLQVWVRTEK